MTTLELQPLCPPWALFLGAAAAALALAWKGARARALPRILHAALLGAIGVIALGPGVRTERLRVPGVEVLLDASGSMARDDRFPAAADCAARLAAPSDAVDFRITAFAGAETRLAPEDIAALRPDGEDTRIGDALARALARAQDTLAIVLISDGANLGGEDPLAAARDAARRRIPIHAISAGVREEAPDGIIALPAGRHIVGDRGDRAAVPVRVMVTGPAPAAAAIEVRRDGGPPVVSEVPLANGAGSLTLALDLPDEPFAVWTVRLAPLPGEKTLENNTAVIAAVTRAPDAAVLLLEGAPAWEGTSLLRGAARDPRIRLRAARLLAPGRPVLRDLAPEDIPLGEEIPRGAAVHVLGRGWESLCRDGRIPAPAAATVLLAGAESPHIDAVAWGPVARGRIDLTEAGARLPALRIIAGRHAAGREVRAPGATPLCTLTTDAGATVTVCALVPERRLLAFGASNLLRVDEDDFFPMLIADAFPAAFAPRLRTEHANYAAGALAVIHGPPGAAVTVTGPGGAAAEPALDGAGRASYRPPQPGLYRLACAGGMSAAFAVQAAAPEFLVRQPDQELMAAIARAAGGVACAPHAGAAADLRAQLEREARARTEHAVAPRWDGMPAFLCLAALALLLWWCGRREHAAG
ncbi:MAG TPA: hypothetical protein DCM87_20980 [Planctomycetes bacterium]|nr:hypothetical protein [Planctomycetota bacterium]